MTRAVELAAALGVTLLGLVAGTAVAHVLKMPHKLAMPYDLWFEVQSTIYDGWGSRLAAMEVVTLVALGLAARHLGRARWPLAAALGLLLVAEAGVFLAWVAPTNTAVESWGGASVLPEWNVLRRDWEWGHAARAAILSAATFVAAWGLIRR